MSKISVEDLDFDDISGNVSIKEPEKEKTIKVSAAPKEIKSSADDYFLAIRTKVDSFKLITLETCTSEQFFHCMSQVYPYMGDTDPNEVYKTRQSKIRTLKHVLSFHSDLFKPLRDAGNILKNRNKPLSN